MSIKLPITPNSNACTAYSKQLIFLCTIVLTSVAHCESGQLSQLTSDITSLESQNPLSSFIGILFILYAVALQSKVHVLWSESRMLRKLLKANSSNLISDITSIDTNVRFAQIFDKISKGRHRHVNRIYPHLYVLFTILVDVASYLGNYLSLPILQMSDAFNSIRLLIYLGSFTVLGARPLSCPEVLLLTFIILVQACFIVLGGIGIIQIPNGLRVTCTTLRVITLVIITITTVVKIARAHRSADSEISQVVNIILENKGRGEPRQTRRLDFMRQLAESDEYESKNRTIMSYWRPDIYELIDILSVLLFAFTNGLVWRELSYGALPVLVVMESLEVVSSFLFFINQTQVEPTLFIELLRIAKKHGDDTAGHD